MSSACLQKLKVALIQFAVSANKEQNVDRICKFIKEAAHNGAKLVCLPSDPCRGELLNYEQKKKARKWLQEIDPDYVPLAIKFDMKESPFPQTYFTGNVVESVYSTQMECFNAPYGIKYFNEYAEEIPGYTSSALSQSAKQNSIYLIGGSIPERNDGKLYNTCLVYDSDGKLIAKHRKVHLFDIDIPGKITFKESAALSAGDSLTMFSLDKWKIGIGICYDIRFPLMANIYAERGCQLLVYPGSFNMTTGPAHWELLQKARAVDNQLYVAGVSPARDENSSYISWGHSSLVNPWGDTVCSADEKENILYADINLSYVEEIRSQIPIKQQQRNDLYSFKCMKDF